MQNENDPPPPYGAYEGVNVAVLQDQYQKGIINQHQYEQAKNDLMISQQPNIEISTQPEGQNIAIPAGSKLINIVPDLNKRVIVELHGNPFEKIPWRQKCLIAMPNILQNILTKDEWDQMMKELAHTPNVACLFPCQWVWIAILVLFFVVLLWTWTWLFLCLIPLGWFLDCFQYILRRFLCKYNRRLRPKGVYIKFQTIKRDFHERHYLSIAFTPDEINKLKREPIFQRGQDIWHQEDGTGRCCPIDSHRVF